MERRTVTPGSWFVTAAFSATDSAGHRSVSVFEPPDGTAVERATELGTTTSAASALAGTASRAMVSEAERANLEGMPHSILTRWARYR
jgi:hypothetical protein